MLNHLTHTPCNAVPRHSVDAFKVTSASAVHGAKHMYKSWLADTTPTACSNLHRSNSTGTKGKRITPGYLDGGLT
ncbi:MAG: hypothetical protein KUG57_05500 [Ilumatobacteraceae bacterium]|nr:hypothetical protein [Ilumatobacteraceae bacterium]